MKRVGALLTPLVAAAVFATPASAKLLSESSAYGAADAQAQSVANASDWTTWWDDACRRDSPWRYTCTLWEGADSGDYAGWECRRNVDVVSPFVGTRLRLERWTRSTCDQNQNE
jgi:hypothetical protein